MNKVPFISIIMPLHNKAQYVTRAVMSIQIQLFTDWELIVVENNSTDDSLDVVRKLADKDRRMRVYDASKEVNGPGAARNFGLDKALGGWVLFFDADDLLAPHHLVSLLTLAREQSADVAVSCWLQFSDFDNASVDSAKTLEKHKPVGQVSLQDLSNYAIAAAPWAIHCALLKKSCLQEESLKWDETMDAFASEDTVFWFKVLIGRKVCFSGEQTALYRVETSNSRNQHHRSGYWCTVLDEVHKRNLAHLEMLGVKPTVKQYECLMRVWEKMYLQLLEQGDEAKAEFAIDKAKAFLHQTRGFLPGIVARKLFGISFFNRIRGFAQ